LFTYHETGDKVFVKNNLQGINHKKLPPNTYAVKFSIISGFYLELMPDFKLPDKIYGDAEKRANRILNTYQDRKQNTGVLLQGTKGSGKTVLSKLVSLQAKKLGFATIVINTAFPDMDNFKTFMSTLGNVVVVLDEYEKVFNEEQQELMLTLLDGTMTTNQLFILSCNSFSRLDKNLINRPGRIFYFYSYNGLDEKTIKDYCEENLIRKELIKDILVLSFTIQDFTFDLLTALVEDLNRYKNDTLNEVLEHINIRPEGSQSYEINLKLKNNDKIEVTTYSIHSPLQEDDFSIEYKIFSSQKKKTKSLEGCSPQPMTSSYEWGEIMFEQKDFVEITKDGSLIYENEKGTVTLSPFIKKSFNYNLLF
jgi:hypothetical protein